MWQFDVRSHMKQNLGDTRLFKDIGSADLKSSHFGTISYWSTPTKYSKWRNNTQENSCGGVHK